MSLDLPPSSLWVQQHRAKTSSKGSPYGLHWFGSKFCLSSNPWVFGEDTRAFNKAAKNKQPDLLVASGAVRSLLWCSGENTPSSSISGSPNPALLGEPRHSKTGFLPEEYLVIEEEFPHWRQGDAKVT